MKKHFYLVSFLVVLASSIFANGTTSVIDTVANEIQPEKRVAKVNMAAYPNPWVKEQGLQYAMAILARTYKNGTLFQPTGALLGIFKNNKCWGYAGIGSSPVGPLFNVTMGYNTTPVTGFNYKLFDATTGKIYDIVETVNFTSNVPVGAINAPISINLKFSITATSSDINKGTVSGSVGSFTSGQTVNVIATPSAGYSFLNWTDGVGGTVMSTNADYTFTANESRSLVANFKTLSNAKLMTSFSLGVVGETAAVIDNDAETVAITVPFGTDVTALTPTIGVSALATCGPSGAQNFTTPQQYTVTAENASTKIYTVTVTIASGDQPTNTFTSVGNGNWTTTASWKSTPNGVDEFTPTSTPGTTAAAVKIMHKITVPASNAVSATDIVVEPTASLLVENTGRLTIPAEGILLLKSDETGTAQLKNDGTVTNNGKVIVRRTFKPEDGWVFVGFPFNVTEANIFIGGTTTPAVWGDLQDNGKDFYIAEYDAQKRDQTGVAVVINSPNWKDVEARVLVANKGYIIGVENEITLDFVSAIGQSAMFNTEAAETLNTFTTNAQIAHHSWNLQAIPFTSSFDLEQASQDQAPFYYFNGTTYATVMSGESYETNPFTAFFVQANPAASTPTTLSFASAGRLVKAALVKNFSEIGLAVKNANYADKTRIRLQDGASAGYEIGKDAMKFYSPKAGVPQIACKQGELDLSVNSVPANTTQVEVTVTITEDGTYTISLDGAAEGCSQVILVDGEAETDLLADDYSFAGTAGSTKNMSVLLVTEGTTAVGTAQGGSILIQTIADKAYISGLEGAAVVNVYDVAGKLVQSFTNVTNDQALTLKAKGVCIIDVNTVTQIGKAKVSVK